ncbi:LysR family transcriptional regulator [Rodentibacter haemolyticus]|uniref:LysR family transcriptional regulator n=1 Tax=Rodentibacter haemolyticus TaxID=2778911 RepID=A0ABX6UZ90_9PAST|nr:LysR family transcriptional regulator [Rodentibacter haemolyticus]QPB43318.1 LysR family transcriptional regulator [Rodentibacter haemolyticus]
MNEIKSILILGKVIETGNMTIAGRELGISNVAVSQHIKQLEQHYGVQLIHRTTRQITPTSAGKILWQTARDIQHALTKTQQNLTALRTEFSGEVAISLPSASIDSRAIRRFLQKMAKDYPSIDVHLLPNDSVVNLFQENIDIALRATEPDNTLIARFLTQWRLCICASPDYLATHPIHRSNELFRHCWIHFHDNIFDHAFATLGLGKFSADKTIHCPIISSAKSLALEGFGLTLQLYGDIEHHLEQGKLALVLPNAPLPIYNLYAVTLHRTQSAKINAVLEVMKSAFME